MKRNLTYAAAAVLLTVGLAGCGLAAPENPSPAANASPSDLELSQPAPAEPVASSPAQSSQPVEPEAEVQEPVYEFPTGIWLAKNDVEFTSYYQFLPESQIALSCSLDYGIIQSYRYEGNGHELVFTSDSYGAHGGKSHEVLHSFDFLPSPEGTFSVLVEDVDDQQFKLHWEHALPETLTFVQDDNTRLEDFPFLCNAALSQLALEHYLGTAALPEEELEGMTTGVMTNVDNTVTVQIYQNLGDHNSAAAWYILDRFTAQGTNLLTGEEVDLLAELPAEEPPAEDTPAEDIPVDGTTGEELPTEEHSTAEESTEELPVEKPEET